MYEANLLFSRSQGLKLNLLDKLERDGILRAETLQDLSKNISNVATRLQGMPCKCAILGDCIVIVSQDIILALYEYEQVGSQYYNFKKAIRG